MRKQCDDCKTDISENEVVMFDDFGLLKAPRELCKTCFKKIIKEHGYNFDAGKCSACGKKLEAVIYDWDDVFYEKLVWFKCPEATENEDSIEHDEIGEYIVQPQN